MAGLAQSHPELARRYQLLVAECWSHGYEIGITSSTRSRETQEDLYRRWLAGTYKVPSVANPNNPHGPSPWGWTIVGSYHMPQADGFSHALDLNWRGCTPTEFETLANKCGLQRTVPNENWHYQWFNRQVIFPAPEPPNAPPADFGDDDDMYFVYATNLDGSPAIHELYTDAGHTVKRPVQGTEWKLLAPRYERTLVKVEWPDLDAIPVS